MTKPIFFFNLSDDGHIVEAQTLHPTKPPQWGGVWTTYAPANTNLSAALDEIEQLKADLANEVKRTGARNFDYLKLCAENERLNDELGEIKEARGY